LHEAATLIHPATSASNPSPVTNRNRDGESVVTKVRPEQTKASQRWLSGRAFVAALTGILLLSIVAVALYKFTQQPPPQAPSVQSAPATNDTATPEPTATAPAEAQNPAPLPAPSVAPATPQQQPLKAPIKVIIRKHDKSGSGENAQPEEMTNNEPDEPPDTLDTPEQPNRPGMSREERARLADELRRARQAMRDAQRQRRDALRAQQNQAMPRRLRRVPPPPN
ncbi:MAG TPA: hypothetical protein VGC89_12980, partial [Pyrinomonadaceae bacterium]